MLTTACGAGAVTSLPVDGASELLGAHDVPDDGQRFAVVGWKQWSELLALPEFASAQFVGDDQLPWRGSQAKMWLGTLWIAHSGLPIEGGVRTCFWYHRSAVGHAIGDGIVTDITWDADRAAHRVTCTLSQGAALIEPDAVVKIPCRETLP